MTSDEFRGLLAEHDDQHLLGICLRDDAVPFVFEPKPAEWDTFRTVLVDNLGCAAADISVVGSARLGLSLKPDMNLRAFTDKSDIDVVVVNAALFDALWLALLAAAYPRPPVTERLGPWLKERRNELYTGYVTPLALRLDPKIYGAKAQPVLETRTLWFNALKEASRYPPRRHEDINGRLYRSWDHAELYHVSSLGALRRSRAP